MTHACLSQRALLWTCLLFLPCVLQPFKLGTSYRDWSCRHSALRPCCGAWSKSIKHANNSSVLWLSAPQLFNTLTMFRLKFDSQIITLWVHCRKDQVQSCFFFIFFFICILYLVRLMMLTASVQGIQQVTVSSKHICCRFKHFLTIDSTPLIINWRTAGWIWCTKLWFFFLCQPDF